MSKKIFEILSDDVRKKLIEKKQPRWIQPMLATLTHDRFSDEDWIYERKFDGERCLVFSAGDDVRLMSRNQKKLNDQYPELVDAFEAQSTSNFIADGEIVTFDGKVTSFSRLQERMHIHNPDEARKSKVPVYIYLFDMPYLEGHDLSQLPLRARKKLLKKAFDYKDPLRFTEHRNRQGEKYFHEACSKGWEGIIAKKDDAEYVHSRSKNWLKFKCVAEQEFVVGGYTEPNGKRIGFGALLVGYYQGDKLRYAGKVGTGYDDDTLRRLHKKMVDLKQNSTPFDEPKDDLPHTEVHWIQPKLVAQIGFEEWTQHDRLRQPRYLGLRDDKSAQDVVREDT
ncbi:MAG: non-homologous end-joining DNA ligase [Anaerolineales bacterium]|jgi:DNA ligase D-like protein (predicted ligase)